MEPDALVQLATASAVGVLEQEDPRARDHAGGDDDDESALNWGVPDGFEESAGLVRVGQVLNGAEQLHK
jgi:hypothetical protein